MVFLFLAEAVEVVSVSGRAGAVGVFSVSIAEAVDAARLAACRAEDLVTLVEVSGCSWFVFGMARKRHCISRAGRMARRWGCCSGSSAVAVHARGLTVPTAAHVLQYRRGRYWTGFSRLPKRWRLAVDGRGRIQVALTSGLRPQGDGW